MSTVSPRHGLLLALLASGCAAAPQLVPRPPAPVDEDLVALLPSGMELVADLDVAQLRAWPSTARLRPQLERWLPSLGGVDPLADVDLVAVGATQTGTDTSEVVVVARGRFVPAQLESALAAAPREDAAATIVEHVPYHGCTILQAGGRALAFVTARTLVWAAPAEVRRVLDIAQGDEAGMRRPAAGAAALAGDGLLVRALARAPEAKSGRPALWAALVPTPAARVRLASSGVPVEIADSIDWASLALALGDGMDLGLVMGMHDAVGAGNLLERARVKLDALRQARVVRLFKLAPLLDTVRLGQKGVEAHFALRLDGRRFNLLWDRLAALFEVTRNPQAWGEAR